MRPDFIRQIDNQNKRPLFLFLFLLIWLTINLIQSAFTELAHDEAYYWMYSRNLAWGYFDHPPLIAVLIKFGYALFSNELGVRLLTSLMGTLTIFIIYCLIDTQGKSLFLFILLICPIILVHTHVGGFLAIPDIPVLFFASLFLLTYKHYLEKDSYLLAITLSILGALMLYSKYHGILLLFFTLVANLKIIRRLSFWIVPVLTAFLLVPHLIWQIKHGFPTFEYHLFSRSSTYTIEHTINFLYSQLLVAGPLVSIIVISKAFGYKARSSFEKVLKTNLVGIFIFFFLTSFRGHVEAHWTAIAYIPMVVLAFHAIQNSSGAIKWLKRLFFPSIILFFIIRLLLIFNILNSNISTLRELHNWDKWSSQIDSLAQGRKVVFVNSFQRPAKYSFYRHGKFAHTLNNIYYRKNQYDIWPFEDSVQHQPVILLQSIGARDSIMTANGERYRYQYVDDFRSYYNLKIFPAKTNLSASPRDTINMRVTLFNPRNESIIFQPGDRIVICYHNGKKYLKAIRVFNLNKQKIKEKGSLGINLNIPLPSYAGKYDLYISIATTNQFPAMNCQPIKVIVE
jgi:hypothetical protein